VLRIHRLLHRILGWAEAVNLVTRNVARSVQPPKAAPSPARALIAEQVGAILTASEGTTLHPFFVVAATTGMRRGEVGALAWNAVDLERRTLTVRQAIGDDRKGNQRIKTTKTGRERVVPVGTAAIEALKRQRAPQAAVRLAAKEGTYDEAADLVFADDHGKPLDLDKVSKAFAALASSLGIKTKGISLHSFRHFAASQAIVAGNDVRTVAALLGHASPSTTLNVYGHVVAGAQERAVAGIDEAIAKAQGRRSAG
jgi:integrase